MTDPRETANPPTQEPDVGLPEVQPPTAGFIVQLFGIPLAIVAVAVVVWLLFGKIATSQRTPQDYLAELKSTNFERRWAAARELAAILPRHKEWQNDQAFAAALASELEQELAAGPTAPNEIRYLQYIAELLGEFYSEAPVPALRMAMKQEVDRDVREAAVMGIGRLADRLGGMQDPQSIADLLDLTTDPDETIRVKAAWVLGRTANPQAIDGLSLLINHSDPELRYNAATSLARLGSSAGLETLSEMLDLDPLRQSLEQRGLTPAQVQSQMEAIPWSALQSLSILLDKNPDTHIEHLRPAIQYASKHGTPIVQTRAKELLIKMGK